MPDVTWITVNGRHVRIEKGESKSDAVSKLGASGKIMMDGDEMTLSKGVVTDGPKYLIGTAINRAPFVHTGTKPNFPLTNERSHVIASLQQGRSVPAEVLADHYETAVKYDKRKEANPVLFARQKANPSTEQIKAEIISAAEQNGLRHDGKSTYKSQGGSMYVKIGKPNKDGDWNDDLGYRISGHGGSGGGAAELTTMNRPEVLSAKISYAKQQMKSLGK